MSEEKTYAFQNMIQGRVTPDELSNYFYLKESELKQHHKDLILGNLIKNFENAPKDVQDKFMAHVLTDPRS